METIDLKLINHQVYHASILLNNHFKPATLSNQIDIMPLFKRSITKLDNDNLIVDLSVKISGEEMPFDLFVGINGHFHLNKWETSEEKKSIAIENSTAILFPYLRQTVTTLTSLGGVLPLVLPVVNTFNLFNKNMKAHNGVK